MYYRGYKMCPYCGGMHPPGQCPMMMYPPAMPPGGMMPGMGGGMMPGMGGMDHMMDMMMKHHQMLERISKCCEEVNQMVREIHMKLAKG